MDDGSQSADCNETGEVSLPEVDSLRRLQVDMAKLEIFTTDLRSTELEASDANLRRSSRKRKPRTIEDFSIANRRCSLRPKRYNHDALESEEQIKEYYLDKTIKKNTNSLETIFEEQEDMRQRKNYMSAKKFRRMIQFTTQPTTSKIKKRKEKVKRLLGTDLNLKKKIKTYVSMNTLLNKLTVMQNNDLVQTSQQVK